MTTAPRPLPATGPNAAQIEYWNETTGPKWVALEERLDAQIAPLGLLAMERLAPARGERVLDVGCGCGQTCLQLAERVGRTGAVLGVDLSGAMLARAAERAEGAGLANVAFENADAQTYAFEAASFDLVYSRFGVMFFADPPAAFANLRRALAPAGRLGFVCWHELARNPWMREPLGAVARHVELPPPPEPGAPGPFSFADADRVRAILAAAGFERIALEPVECRLTLAGGLPLEEAARFMLDVGPAAAALREAPERREGALASVLEVLRDRATPEGVVMDAAIWIASARNRD